MALLLFVGAAPSTGEQIVRGVTQPVRSNQVKLSVNQLGIVRDLPIKVGDRVSAGQLLVGLDDRLEVNRLSQAELEAASTVRIDATRAALEIRQLELERYKRMFAEGAARQAELDEANLAVVEAEARVKIAELEYAKADLEVQAFQIRISQMKLLSPIDGIVESIDVGVGEIVDPSRPVCTVVRNDPLWVEIRNMPAALAGRVKVGDKLDVRYDARYSGTPIHDGNWMSAEVVYKAPVVDAKSDTQLVRLETANPRGLESGLVVEVRLPSTLAQAPAR